MSRANLIRGEWVEGSSTVTDVNPSDLSDVVDEFAVADVGQDLLKQRPVPIGMQS